MGWQLDSLDTTSDVEFFGGLVEVLDGRVGKVIGTVHLFRFNVLVRTVNVGDWACQHRTSQWTSTLTGEDGKGRLVSWISKCHPDSLCQAQDLDVLLGDIERNGHGEESTLSLTVESLQSKGITDTQVIGLIHESLERGEPAAHDEFKVT